MDEIDAWRAADELVKRHTMTAEVIAARRIQTMTERGDDAGAAAWRRILAAVKQLRRAGRKAAVHCSSLAPQRATQTLTFEHDLERLRSAATGVTPRISI